MNSLPRTWRGAMLVAAVLPALGCSRWWAAAEEEIEERARRAAPGQIPEEPPVVPEDPIQVNSLLPNRGETGGGLLVEIVGLAFAPEMTVWFGDVPAADVDVLTESRIQVVTPPAPVGVVDVYVVESESRFGVLTNGFEYYAPVTLERVEPTRGSSLGGDSLVLYGGGFVDGTSVRFGDGAPRTAVVVDATRCQVLTPPLPHGVYAVTVSNANGSATLNNAFSTWDPVRLRAITPFAGPISGGTPIVVTGTGYVDPTSLTLGGQELAAVADPGEGALSAVTLPADPPVEGVVAATVSNANGTATLANAFAFIDTSDPTPRIVAVSPATGLVDGGRAVQIAGLGFDAAGLAVTFGGAAADCVIVDDHTLSCVTPPGPEGAVDVRVVNLNVDLTAPGAFTYVALRLDALLPNRGAIAGNTWVDLWGNGFAPDTEVFLGGAPARAVNVAGNDRLSLRTPANAAGVVDLRIATQGVELTFPGVYTYFNPYNSDFWSSGGPIDGAVNITVVDWNTNARIPGALVMLGLDPTTEQQGFTDARGQVTLSGPEVVGAQTVTAGKPGHALFSWVDVNAENLTLLLLAAAEPSFPPGEPGPPPPVVRGNIIRIKDEYNTGTDLVLVGTTYRDFSTPLPDPGPRSFLVSQGPYELWARPGDLIVVAQAGTVGPGNRLITATMGFHPFLLTEVGSGTPCGADADCPLGESCYQFGAAPRVCTHVYDGVDIVIDTPLKQPLVIQMDDPPLADDVSEYGLMPDTTAAFVYYDFGSMGLLPMADVGVSFTDTVVAPMPRRLPGALAGTPFYVFAGVYLGFDDDLDPATPPSLYPPQSEVRLPPYTDTTQPVLATPVLGTVQERSPATGGYVEPGPGGKGLRFIFGSNKPLPPSAYLHLFFLDGQAIEWMVLGGGSQFNFSLPIVPDVISELRLLPDDPLDPHLHYWQIMGMDEPTVQFNRLDPVAWFGWRSRSLHATYFLVP